MASISVTPRARAASSMWPKISSFRIRAPHLDVAESSRAGAVSRPHHLLRLPLAAVRYAPQRPILAAGNRGAGIPELGGDAAITRIFQHAHALAVADLPADL